MENINGDASLCFSGGLDSTMAVFLLAEKFAGNVHLLTMLHNHGQFFPGLSRRPVKALKKILGEDKIEHHFLSTKKIFKKIVTDSLLPDGGKYGWQIACCLGCHLGFAAALTIYNLEHGIKHMAIASCPHDAEECFNAQPPVVEGLEKIYSRYGIIYSHPLIELNIDKEQAKAYLEEHGIRMHVRVRHRTLGTQPICLLGFFLTWPDIFTNWKPDYDFEIMAAYIREKNPLIDEFIRDYFHQSGQNLDKLINRLKEKP